MGDVGLGWNIGEIEVGKDCHHATRAYSRKVFGTEVAGYVQGAQIGIRKRIEHQGI